MSQFATRRGLPSRSYVEVEQARLKTWKETHTKTRYERKIKNRCFLCRIWFKNDWWHYYHYGNCCRTCTGRVIRIKFSSKQKNKAQVSPQEAFEMLQLRREYVVRNYLHLSPGRRPKKFKPQPIPKEEVLLLRVRLLGGTSAGWDYARSPLKPVMFAS